jgi:hypothetical protein
MSQRILFFGQFGLEKELVKDRGGGQRLHYRVKETGVANVYQSAEQRLLFVLLAIALMCTLIWILLDQLDFRLLDPSFIMVRVSQKMHLKLLFNSVDVDNVRLDKFVLIGKVRQNLISDC